MTKESSESCSAQDRPLGRAELHKCQFDESVTEEVPKKLREIDLIPSPLPFKHATIERKSLDTVPNDPLVPFRPKWIASVERPKRVSLPGQPKKKLWHYGAELDPLFIWQPDDRRIYNDTRYPWGCVCRIVTAAVLTASHVVDWNANGAGTVEVHRAGPAISATSVITKVWYFTKISPPNVGWSEVDEDYAVLITADRIGDRFGWLGVRTYDSSWDDEPYWRNIGYPTDIGRLFPVYQRDKELDEDEFDYGSGRSMTTSADTWPGQSGSPLFAFWEDGPYVVAVVSAQGTYFLSGDENWCSGGSDMTRLVSQARSDDP
jgi:V8-like Glu-specific endopeptidase